MAIDQEKMQNEETLSWDQLNEQELAEVEHSYTFVSAEIERYPYAYWHNGYNCEVDFIKGRAVDTERKNRGMFFKISDLPDDLREVFERMAEDEKLKEKDRLAKLVSVRHEHKDEEGNDIVEYYRLDMSKARFFPLMTALPKLKEMTDGSLFKGPICTYDLNPNKKKGKYTFNKNLSILLVVDVLYQYGYVDDSGLPKPIRLRMNAYAGTELYTVLRRQNQLIGWAIGKGIKFGTKKTEDPEPYMIGFQFDDSKDIKHGSNEEKRKPAVEVLSFIPAPKDLSPEYVQKMYAGVELHNKMKRMLYVPAKVNGKIMLKPEGPVIVWGREQTERAINYVKKMNPDNQKLSYGENDIPTWMHAILNGDTKAGTETFALPKYDKVTMLRQVEILIEGFTELLNDDALEVLIEAKEQIENAESEEALKTVRPILDTYTEEYKKLQDRPASLGEEDPF